jgi:hypothetical protein
VCRLIRELRQGGQSSARNDEQIVGECQPLFQPFEEWFWVVAAYRWVRGSAAVTILDGHGCRYSRLRVVALPKKHAR